MAVRALLARAPGLTRQNLLDLTVAAAGDITRVLEPQLLATATGLTPAAARALRNPDKAALDTDLNWIASSGAQLLAACDAQYPSQLEFPNAPAVLYVLGAADTLHNLQVAIVGSRAASPAGIRTAREFAAGLARAGLTITSGLAVGIDAAAHEGALLAGGSTVAVCGTGLDTIYPTQHIALAGRIRAQGALVSHLPPRSAFAKGHFPQRNALIAALCQGTVIVEAARYSGSLSTARHARKRARTVFAVPGSIYNPLSQGCHALIRGGATLVQQPSQVVAQLGIPVSNEALGGRTQRRSGGPALDKGLQMLLDAVGFEPAGVDALAARTGVAGESIASMLLILELEGRIAPYPGGRYGRIP